MAKLTLADLTNLQNETSAVAAINANSALIETALENTLSRDGSSPNTMGASLDMNSNRILNLPEPIGDTEPVRLQDMAGTITVVNGLSAYGVTLMSAASASAARTVLGLGTSATVATGTTGAVIPLLNGTNTHSGVNTFSNTTNASSGITGALIVSGGIGLAKTLWCAAGTAAVAPQVMTAGTNLTSAQVGATEYDGQVQYFTPNGTNRAVVTTQHCIIATGTNTLADVNTAQNLFSTNISLPALTTYFFDLRFVLSRAAGTTSHTITVLFGGAATFTSINFDIQSTSTTGNALGAISSIFAAAASGAVATAASTTATENNIFTVKGVMRINGAGTVIPQVTYSAAPGGAPTVQANASFRCWPVGTNTVVSVGSFA